MLLPQLAKCCRRLTSRSAAACSATRRRRSSCRPILRHRSRQPGHRLPAGPRLPAMNSAPQSRQTSSTGPRRRCSTHHRFRHSLPQNKTRAARSRLDQRRAAASASGCTRSPGHVSFAKSWQRGGSRRSQGFDPAPSMPVSFRCEKRGRGCSIGRRCWATWQRWQSTIRFPASLSPGSPGLLTAWCASTFSALPQLTHR